MSRPGPVPSGYREDEGPDATHVTANFTPLETLEDVLEHPERNRDLVVRVTGFSAYFVNLGSVVQREILSGYA